MMKFFLFFLISNIQGFKILTRDQLDKDLIPNDVLDEHFIELKGLPYKKAAFDFFLFVKNNFFREIYFYFNSTRQFDEQKFQEFIMKYFRIEVEDEKKHMGSTSDKKEELRVDNEEKKIENFEETQKFPKFKEVYSIYDTANKFKLFTFRIHSQGNRYKSAFPEIEPITPRQFQGSLGQKAKDTGKKALNYFFGSGQKTEKFQTFQKIEKKFISAILYNKNNKQEFTIEYNLYNNDKYLEFQTKKIHGFLKDIKQHVFSMHQIQNYLFKSLQIELLLYPKLKNQLADKEPKEMDQQVFESNPEFILQPDLNRESLKKTFESYLIQPDESRKINQFYVQMISPFVHENQEVISLFKERIETIQFFQENNLDECIQEKEWAVFVLTPVDRQQDTIFMYGVFRYFDEEAKQQLNGVYFYTESNQLNQQFEIKTLTYNFIMQQFNFILKEVKQNILFYFEQIQIDFKGQKADEQKIKEVLPDIMYTTNEGIPGKMQEIISVEDKYTLSVSNGETFFSKKSYPIYSQFNPFTNMQYYFDIIQRTIKLVESPCPTGYDLRKDGKCHNVEQYDDVQDFTQEDKHIRVYAESMQTEDMFRTQEIALGIRWHQKEIGSFAEDRLESFTKEFLKEPEFYCKWDFITEKIEDNNKDLL